jgi:hypothetical protein
MTTPFAFLAKATGVDDGGTNVTTNGKKHRYLLDAANVDHKFDRILARRWQIIECRTLVMIPTGSGGNERITLWIIARLFEQLCMVLMKESYGRLQPNRRIGYFFSTNARYGKQSSLCAGV